MTGQGPGAPSSLTLDAAGEYLLDPCDLGLFAPRQQTLLQGLDATVSQIIAGGPAAFDSADASMRLGTAVQTIAAVKTVPCSKME